MLTDVLNFAVYYPIFRLRVFFNRHHTPNPIGIRWRWYYRKHRDESSRREAARMAEEETRSSLITSHSREEIFPQDQIPADQLHNQT